jgi:hypothetical protein
MAMRAKTQDMTLPFPAVRLHEQRVSPRLRYDDLNRLTSANTGGSLWGSGSYSYDAMGNLLSSALGVTTTTFSYSGTTPKLTGVTSGSTTNVTYDDAGNELQAGTSQVISSRNLVREIIGTNTRNVLLYDGRNVRREAESAGR